MSNSTHHEFRGMICVALSAILYGLLGFLGTNLLTQLSVESMLFWRFFLATIWIFIVILFYKRNLFRNFKRQNIPWIAIILGVMCYSGGSVFYFMASREIGTGIAMVVFFSYPIFVFLFCWIFSDWRGNFLNIASIILVCVGLLCLKGAGTHALTMTGLFFATLASISYAVYVYGSQFNARSIDTMLLTFLVCLGNTIIFFIISLSTHSLHMPTSFNMWIYALAIGVIATAIPIQLLLEGLKHILPMKASILSVFEPIVTVLIGVALLHETLTTLQSIGMLIVLIAAILIQFDKISHQPLEE